MNMLFLYMLPLAALPVIFHLLFKGKVRTKIMPSLMFFTRIDPRMNSRRKIFQWLVLLLRCAFIAALLFALARPVVEQYLASGQNAARVIILDNSASMKARNKNGVTLWQQAADRLQAILAPGRGDDVYALVGVVDDAFLPDFNFADKDTTETLSKLIQPTDSAGSPALALSKAVKLLQSTNGMVRQIHIITDLQEYQWKIKKEEVPDDIQVFVHALKHEKAGDSSVAIESIAADKGVRLAGQDIPINIRLKSQSAKDNGVSVFIRQSNGAESDSFAQLQAGKDYILRVNAEGVLEGFNWLRAGLNIDGDLIANEAFLAFDASQKHHVLLVTDKLQGRFLQRALSPDSKGTLSGLLPEYITASNIKSSLSANNVPLVIAQAGALDRGAYGELSEYVKAGGALLLLPAANGSSNSSLPEWCGGQFAGKVELKPRQELVIQDFKSALWDGLDSGGRLTLGKVWVESFSKINPDNKSSVLATLTAKQPALIHKNYGRGQVFISALPLDGKASNFTFKPAFVAFVQNLARLGITKSSDDNVINIIAGQQLPENGISSAVAVREITGSNKEYTVDKLPAISYRGVYALNSQEGRKFVAVSPDAREADRNFLTADKESVIGGIKYRVVPDLSGAELSEWLVRQDSGLQLYPYLLLLGLFCFVLEGWLANGGYRVPKKTPATVSAPVMIPFAINWYPGFEPLVTALIILVLIAVTVLSGYRLYKNRGRKIAALLLALRLPVVVLLILAVFDPSIDVSDNAGQNRKLLLLVDNSASMQSGNKKTTRYSASLNLMPRFKKDFPGYEFETRNFNTTVSPAEGITPAAGNRGTDLGAVYSWLNNPEFESKYAHAILLTDGGDEIPEIARFPVFGVSVLGVGSTEGSNNIFIKQVLAPSTAEPGEKFEARVTLGANVADHAFREKIKKIAVRLEREIGADKWLKLSELQADLSTGGAEIVFSASSQKKGVELYRVAINQVDGDFSKLDDERTFSVECVDKKIKVLYFSTEFGNSFKVIRQSLRSDPGVDFSALLRTVGGRYIYQGSSRKDKKSLREFPDNAKMLKEYNCLILGSFPPESLNSGQYRAISEYVSGGGGVIILGGIHLAGLFSTALEPVLPWRAGNNPGLVSGDFLFVFSNPVAPSLAGFKEAVDEYGARLSSVSVVGSSNLLTEVLISTRAMQRETPVLSLRQVKLGRVMGIATDSLWQLSRINRSLASAIETFWRQQVRTVSSVKGASGVFSVEWDRQYYRPGEKAQGVITFDLQQGKIPDFKAILTHAGKKSYPQISVAGKNRRTFSLILDTRGKYELQLEASISGKVVERNNYSFDVASLLPEGSYIDIDQQGLSALADKSSGVFFTEADYLKFSEALRRVLKKNEQTVQQKVVSLGPWFISLLLLLVALEYIVRKRKGLI